MTPRVETLAKLRGQAQPCGSGSCYSRLVTPADFAAFQQQLNSINTALQNISARPAESKPCRISDFIPRNWDGSNEKGEFRSIMSDLHLWMQAWSDQGEKMLARVESIDKVDNNVIAFDCSDQEFRSIEASLYQVLHKTTSSEPLRIVQPTKGLKGVEAWHAIVRRYDQRNMSDQNSAYAALINAALISNISEKDRSSLTTC